MNIRHFAHRGSRGLDKSSNLCAENSYRAFKNAYDRGWYGVEIDIQLTKDEKLAVFHDDTLDEKSTGKGHVRDNNLDTIESLEYRGFIDKIISFDKFLNHFHKKPVYFEVKIAEDLFYDKKYCIETAKTFLEYINKSMHIFSTSSFIASSSPVVTDYFLSKDKVLPFPYVISHDYYSAFIEDYKQKERAEKKIWSIPYNLWCQLDSETQRDVKERIFLWDIPSNELSKLLKLPFKGLISDDFYGIDRIFNDDNSRTRF